METVFPQRPVGAAPPHARERLAPINGLRGVAIVGVLYFHVASGLWTVDQLPLWLAPLLTNTWTGVDLFFILSGFVLFLPLVADEGAMGTVSDRARFYRRRALRLLPLFYVSVIVLWAIAALRGTSGLGELLSVVSFDFVVDARSFYPSFNGPLWSIGVEVAFSAVFPMLVLARRRFGMAPLTGFVLAFAFAVRLIGCIRNPPVAGNNFNIEFFPCRLDEFVLGMMVAQLYVERRLPRHAGFCLLAGALLVILAWTGFDLTARHLLPIPFRAALNDVLDAGLCLVVLAALVPGTRIAAALSWRPLQLLGMMCYSLYIWHWPLLRWVMPDRATLPGSTFAAAVVCFLVLTLTVAALSYRFIEFGQRRDWRRLFLIEPATHPVPPRLIAP